jgi:hypothetical protein
MHTNHECSIARRNVAQYSQHSFAVVTIESRGSAQGCGGRGSPAGPAADMPWPAICCVADAPCSHVAVLIRSVMDCSWTSALNDNKREA